MSDPLYQYKKSQDDWHPVIKQKKRKLNLLPTRKYIRSKGTMVRVKVPPIPAIPCVVMRWLDGMPDAVPTDYIESEKALVPLVVKDAEAYVFPSRSQAKKAIWHTVQYEKIPGGHVDFIIVNKMSLQGV